MEMLHKTSSLISFLDLFRSSHASTLLLSDFRGTEYSSST